MEVFLTMFLLLLAARACGEIAERLGHTASVGELLAGILLGVAILPFSKAFPALGAMATLDVLDELIAAGMFFLMLMAGIELRPQEVRNNARLSLGVAVGGMALPLALGYGFVLVFFPEHPLRTTVALLVGIALSVSAVPTTIKVFSDFGLLHHVIGRTVIAAALFDDVLGLALLVVLVALVEYGALPGLPEFAALTTKSALFFAITIGLGTRVYPHLHRRARVLQMAAVEFSVLMLVALGYCLLAELLGIHWILGAFMAGLFFEPARVSQRAWLEMKLIVSAIAGGVLGPIFFASIGLKVDLAVLLVIPQVVIALVVLALVGKIVGAGVPALIGGLRPVDALAVGIGMSARGAVELIVLGIAVQAGFFAALDSHPVMQHLFSALVLSTTFATILTPILLRFVLSRQNGGMATGKDQSRLS